jgi:hypothetical protein
MITHNTAAYEIDEALWEAYRRYDKSAVMERLIARYLSGLAVLAKARSTFNRAHKSSRNQRPIGAIRKVST